MLKIVDYGGDDFILFLHFGDTLFLKIQNCTDSIPHIFVSHQCSEAAQDNRELVLVNGEPVRDFSLVVFGKILQCISILINGLILFEFVIKDGSGVDCDLRIDGLICRHDVGAGVVASVQIDFADLLSFHVATCIELQVDLSVIGVVHVFNNAFRL